MSRATEAARGRERLQNARRHAAQEILSRIGDRNLPTLLLNAANDSFVPPAALPAAAELSSRVHFECPAGGGHVGFVGGPWPGSQDWLARRLLKHFDTNADGAR